jgi:hypothetical protein
LIEFKIFESVVADDQQRRSASVMAKILLIWEPFCNRRSVHHPEVMDWTAGFDGFWPSGNNRNFLNFFMWEFRSEPFFRTFRMKMKLLQTLMSRALNCYATLIQHCGVLPEWKAVFSEVKTRECNTLLPQLSAIWRRKSELSRGDDQYAERIPQNVWTKRIFFDQVMK